MPQSLYDNPDLYRRVFATDVDDAAFFSFMVPEDTLNPRILDLACGPLPVGPVVARIHGGFAVGLDCIAQPGAAAAFVQADAGALPFRSGSFDLIFSRLFGCAYAIGGGVNPSSIAKELRRCTASRGQVALEVPLVNTPSKIVGLTETAQIEPGIAYCFQYLDVLHENGYGAILDSMITVRTEDATWEIHAPLQVFSPKGAAQWMAAMGFSVISFFAPYQIKSETSTPPEDCLRGIVAGRRDYRC
ncbi:hypothetical protein BH09SUM1_BH09SUM1_20760 [soil metagenome]